MTLAALLVAIGCAGPWRLPWDVAPDPSRRPSTTDDVLAEPETELAAGQARSAATAYERIARDYAGQDVAAHALHDLAVLRIDPRSPLRDRRVAQALLARLAAEYPDTHWGREARGWHVLFRSIDRCEVEATQLGADADRLRQTIDSLKDSDLELERHP